SDGQRLPRLHFFRILRKLYHTNPFQKARLRKIKQEIQQKDALSSKAWLLEQVQEKIDWNF
ncbi:MAG: hypothetical protein AAF206_22500, partial [Bacteroidota bacterium]